MEPVFRGGPGEDAPVHQPASRDGGGPQSRTGPAASHGDSGFARQARGPGGLWGVSAAPRASSLS